MLIDTGVGEGGFNATKGRRASSPAISRLQASNPKAIDTVIISHYHGDHMNGLLKADGSLTYPNAEVLVPAKEHGSGWTTAKWRARRRAAMEDLFKNNRRVFTSEAVSSGCAPMSGTRTSSLA